MWYRLRQDHIWYHIAICKKHFTPAASENHYRMAMTGKPQNPQNKGVMMSAAESYAK